MSLRSKQHITVRLLAAATLLTLGSVATPYPTNVWGGEGSEETRPREVSSRVKQFQEEWQKLRELLTQASLTLPLLGHHGEPAPRTVQLPEAMRHFLHTSISDLAQLRNYDAVAVSWAAAEADKENRNQPLPQFNNILLPSSVEDLVHRFSNLGLHQHALLTYIENVKFQVRKLLSLLAELEASTAEERHTMATQWPSGMLNSLDTAMEALIESMSDGQVERLIAAQNRIIQQSKIITLNGNRRVYSLGYPTLRAWQDSSPALMNLASYHQTRAQIMDQITVLTREPRSSELQPMTVAEASASRDAALAPSGAGRDLTRASEEMIRLLQQLKEQKLRLPLQAAALADLSSLPTTRGPSAGSAGGSGTPRTRPHPRSYAATKRPPTSEASSTRQKLEAFNQTLTQTLSYVQIDRRVWEETYMLNVEKSAELYAARHVIAGSLDAAAQQAIAAHPQDQAEIEQLLADTKQKIQTFEGKLPSLPALDPSSPRGTGPRAEL